MWINLLNEELQKVGRTIEHRMTKEKTMNIERLNLHRAINVENTKSRMLATRRRMPPSVEQTKHRNYLTLKAIQK